MSRFPIIPSPELSIIVPTLNESGHITQTLQRIWQERGESRIEVLVVDAGSTDGTPEQAASLAEVVQFYRGRALQMNAGAALACGEILLFCHGDTLLPHDYAAQLTQALQDPGVVGGVFSHRWDSSSRLLRILAWVVSLPYHYCMFGDQGLFVRRSVFESLGSYPAIPLMEDVRFVRMLNGAGKLVRLKSRVRTSARRFHENGVRRQILLDLRLYLADFWNPDPVKAARRYNITHRDRATTDSREQFMSQPGNP